MTYGPPQGYPPPQPPAYYPAPQAPPYPAYGQPPANPPPPGHVPPPMGYGAPVPYGYPAYPSPFVAAPGPYVPPPPGKETLEALDRLRQAAFLGMAASILTSLVGFYAVGLLATGAPQSTMFTAPGFGLHVLAFIMQVITVAVAWMGLDDLKDGAREIHQHHIDRFRPAWNFLLFAGLTWLLGGLAGMLFGGFAFFTSVFSGPGGAGNAGVLVYQTSFGVVGLIMNVLIALALQLGIADLMQRPGRNLARTFYALAIGGTAVSFALALSSDLFWGAPNIAPVASVLSVAALFVWLKQLDSARAGTKVLVTLRGGDPDAAMPATASYG